MCGTFIVVPRRTGWFGGLQGRASAGVRRRPAGRSRTQRSRARRRLAALVCDPVESGPGELRASLLEALFDRVDESLLGYAAVGGDRRKIRSLRDGGVELLAWHSSQGARVVHRGLPLSVETSTCDRTRARSSHSGICPPTPGTCIIAPPCRLTVSAGRVLGWLSNHRNALDNHRRFAAACGGLRERGCGAVRRGVLWPTEVQWCWVGGVWVVRRP